MPVGRDSYHCLVDRALVPRGFLEGPVDAFGHELIDDALLRGHLLEEYAHVFGLATLRPMQRQRLPRHIRIFVHRDGRFDADPAAIPREHTQRGVWVRPQVPEYGAVCKEAAAKQLAWLDGELAKSRFIAGDRYTIADITALVGIDFGKVTDIRIQPEQKNLTRWYQEVSTRPSAKA